MTDTKEIISKLKMVRKEKNLSYNDILNLMEKNGDYLSKSTISRVFQEDSENLSFRYEETIRPIAKALLDIETIEDNDNADVQAMKSLLQYKIQRIEELEWQIEHLEALYNKEKAQIYEKMEAERKIWNKSIEFLKEQISIKDKWINYLFQSAQSKDLQQMELMQKILSCPCRNTQEGENKQL